MKHPDYMLDASIEVQCVTYCNLSLYCVSWIRDSDITTRHPAHNGPTAHAFMAILRSMEDQIDSRACTDQGMLLRRAAAHAAVPCVQPGDPRCRQAAPGEDRRATGQCEARGNGARDNGG